MPIQSKTYQYPFKTADEQFRRAVFGKGTPIDGYDPATWRRDRCGHAIRWQDHGDTNSTYGWEIDHIRPLALGGKTELANLQPLYWENNRRKGDSYPWSC